MKTALAFKNDELLLSKIYSIHALCEIFEYIFELFLIRTFHSIPFQFKVTFEVYPIHLAIICNRFETVELLLKKINEMESSEKKLMTILKQKTKLLFP